MWISSCIKFYTPADFFILVLQNVTTRRSVTVPRTMFDSISAITVGLSDMLPVSAVNMIHDLTFKI